MGGGGGGECEVAPGAVEARLGAGASAAPASGTAGASAAMLTRRITAVVLVRLAAVAVEVGGARARVGVRRDVVVGLRAGIVTRAAVLARAGFALVDVRGAGVTAVAGLAVARERRVGARRCVLAVAVVVARRRVHGTVVLVCLAHVAAPALGARASEAVSVGLGHRRAAFVILCAVVRLGLGATPAIRARRRCALLQRNAGHIGGVTVSVFPTARRRTGVVDGFVFLRPEAVAAFDTARGGFVERSLGGDRDRSGVVGARGALLGVAEGEGVQRAGLDLLLVRVGEPARIVLAACVGELRVASGEALKDPDAFPGAVVVARAACRPRAVVAGHRGELEHNAAAVARVIHPGVL